MIAQMLISDDPFPSSCLHCLGTLFFISPHSLGLLLFLYHSTLRFHWVVSCWSNIFWDLVARYCITCPGCRFHIFPVNRLAQCPAGCVGTIRPRRSFSVNCVTYSGTPSTLPVVFSFFLSLYIVACSLLLLIIFSFLRDFVFFISVVFYHILLRRLCISTLLVCPHNWWACCYYIQHGYHECSCGVQSNFHLGCMPCSSSIVSLSISCT